VRTISLPDCRHPCRKAGSRNFLGAITGRLLIVLARTISFTSIVAASVTRNPPTMVLDAEPLQHLGNLRPATVNNDRVDANLLEQDDVAGERISGCRVAHRMAAVLDDEGAAGVTAHIGQGL
jgi:hypothetical protein